MKPTVNYTDKTSAEKHQSLQYGKSVEGLNILQAANEISSGMSLRVLPENNINVSSEENSIDTRPSLTKSSSLGNK